jgi:hypothetical protein
VEATTVEAAAVTATGKGGSRGRSEQDGRCADDAEVVNAEQSRHCQTTRQDIAKGRSVLSHRGLQFRASFKRRHGKPRFLSRFRSNHLDVIVAAPEAAHKFRRTRCQE